MERVRTTLFRAEGFHTFAGAPVQEVLVADGNVLATGGRGEISRSLVDEIVDLDGWATPGFNDAHMHPSMMAQNLLYVDLSPEAASSTEELYAALHARAGSQAADEWLIGARYDESKTTEGRVITRDDLDRMFPDRPVLILHVAVHWGVANSRALALAGLSEDSSDPAGGQFGRYADGRLNGVLYEQALFDVAYPSLSRGAPVVTPHSLPARLAALGELQQRFHAAGLTSVCDALCGPQEIALLSSARKEGLLTMRTGFLVAHPHYERVRSTGWNSGWGDDMLRFVGVKAFVDGACAGGNCLLDEPFEGTDDHGMQVTSEEELHALIMRVALDAVPIGVHANGDRAIRMVLDGHERARAAGAPPARHRIEHCTLVDDGILHRMKELALTAVPFGSYARFHGDKLEKYYGAARLERMFAHRSFLETGVRVAGSSDYPCGPYEPLEAIASCVQRRALDGSDVGPSQRISVAEAWRLYTVDSAYASGDEHRKGTLAPGMLADFITFDSDPLAGEPDAAQDLRVRSTWVGGSLVWS